MKIVLGNERVVPVLGFGCEAIRIRRISDAPGFHIRQYRAEPAEIQPALLRHVLHQI